MFSIIWEILIFLDIFYLEKNVSIKYLSISVLKNTSSAKCNLVLQMMGFMIIKVQDHCIIILILDISK